MAKINKSDIINDKDIVKAFETVNEALKKTSQYFKETVTEAEKLKTSLNKIDGFNDLIKAQKEYDKVQKDAITTQKSLIDLQTKEVKLREATAKAQLTEQKITESATKSEIAANKEAEKTAKNLAKETSLYAQKSKALTEARNKAKELAIQYGVNSKEFKKAADEVNKLDKSLKDIDGKLGQHQRNVGNYAKAWDSLKGSIAWISGIGAAVAGLAAAGMQALQVFRDFEKYKAILTNTFGSAQEADEAMKMLRDAAQSLPMALDELVQSYIKLVNRGIKPTKEELTKLADVAYSQGKSMDMFVEAILDAQTGEFERLKEFGIKASKSGDQVTFKFKEQTQTVKFTESAIKDYLVALGDMQGVAGSSAAVMGTLEGKISNLGDAWDSLLLMFGEGGAGALSKKIVDLFIIWIEKAKEYVGAIQDSFKQFVPWWNGLIKSSVGFRGIIESIFQTFVVGLKIASTPLKLFYEQIKGVVLAIGNLSQGNFKDAFNNIIDAQKNFAGAIGDTAGTIYDAFKSIKTVAGGEGYEKYLIDLTKTEAQINKTTAATKKQTEAIKENNIAKGGSPTPKKENIAKLSSITATPLVDTTELDMAQVNADALIDLNKWKNDKIKEQDEEALNEKIRQEEYKTQLEQQLKADSYAVGKELLNTMFEIEQNNYDKDIKRIEDKYSIQENSIKKQLDDDKLTVQSRAQLEGQLSAIEAKRAEEIQAVENKKRESQRKQFIINKAIALAEIAVSTAQGIAKTVANLGLPAATPFAIWAGALGAAQAAVVLAQPMPAFDKGTNNAPNTPFLVGERGAEFVTKNGQTQLVTEPTVMSGMGGAKITSRVETQRILEQNNRNAVWSALNKGSQMNSYNDLLAEQRKTNDLLRHKEPITIHNSTNITSRAQIGHNTLINKLRK